MDLVKTVKEIANREKIYSRWDRLPKGTAKEGITEGCLVLEGGAFRGLYTQGLLDCWMRHGLNMQTVIGVSAGALGAVSYVSGQIGRSARANLGYRHDSNYIGVDAIRHSHSLINLDFLIYDYNKIEPLDMERFNDPRRRLVAVATNCENGRPQFFERSNCKDFFSAIKASASMPFITPMVDVDGKKCLDGGCSDAIPYQWAIDQGYDKIIVVKTHEHGFRPTDPKESSRARRLYIRHPEFAKELDMSSIRYNEQYEEMDRLAEQGRILLIEPSEPVTVSRVEGDMEKLGELYWLGYNDGERTFDQVIDYLGAKRLGEGRPKIRAAEASDAEALANIYRPYVMDTAITFDLEPPKADHFADKIAKSKEEGYPFLVASVSDQIVGFAYADRFKDRAAYDNSAETSIYIRKDLRALGYGHQLYKALEDCLRNKGTKNLYACIASTEAKDDAHLDDGSIIFHSGLGYKVIGHFSKCAYKFGTWYDMVYMEKFIAEHETNQR